MNLQSVAAISTNHDKTAAPLLPEGVWPVAITPFCASGEIDWNGYDRLLDWYFEKGAAGLFAVCLSSEFFELTSAEMAGLARRAVERFGTRRPVVCGGGLGTTLPTVIESVLRMADTGVDAVVIPANQLLREDEPAERLMERLETVLAQTGSIRLGLYECPLPYRRGLTVEQLASCARTGRFFFFKDTCCNAAEIGRRVAAVAGSPMRVYNANITTLLESLALGVHGYDGPAANFFPDLIDRMIKTYFCDPALAARWRDLILTGQRVLSWKYLRTVKNYLRLEGLPITDTVRMTCPALDWEDLECLHSYHRLVGQIRRELL